MHYSREKNFMSSTKHLITVADLDDFPDDDGNRYELIEGELLVSCAPGLPHQLVLQNLQGELYIFLKRHPIGKAAPGAGAVFSNFDAVIPDLVFVSNERWDQIVADARFVAAPDLVIEIVSPGRQNRRRDLDLKKRLYGTYGVQEYWIVDPEDRSVTVYELKESTLQEVAVIRDNQKICSRILIDLDLEAASLFKI
jgi:Uma2 family endonuclease